jgi:hypothetical protein
MAVGDRRSQGGSVRSARAIGRHAGTTLRPAVVIIPPVSKTRYTRANSLRLSSLALFAAADSSCLIVCSTVNLAVLLIHTGSIATSTEIEYDREPRSRPRSGSRVRQHSLESDNMVPVSPPVSGNDDATLRGLPAMD